MKTFSMQVVTPEHIKRDPRKMKLLYIVRELGAVSERALAHLLHLAKEEKGLDLGYNFVVLGGKPVSRELMEDIRALLYVGFLENDPRTRKLKVTSMGLEFMEKNPLPPEEIKDVISVVNELKPRISSIDAEVELAKEELTPRRRRRI